MEQNVKLLKGTRFDDESNMVYTYPYSELPRKRMTVGAESIEVIDLESEEMKKIVIYFINHHREKQVPRLKVLKRYWLADNDINYVESKRDEYRADNRIASDFAKFVVTFNQGVVVGNPVEYSGEGQVAEWVEEFAERINDGYHNQLMVSACGIYGRAYEQVYRDEQSDEKVARLNPEETFVVYDATIDKPSLFSCRYYDTKLLNETISTVELMSKDGIRATFTCKNQDYENWELKEDESGETFFDAVTVNEWSNNEDRTADFEAVMSEIDAYDLSQSELANFQQDSSDAYLVIAGNPLTGTDEVDESGRKIDGGEVLKEMRRARMLILGDPTMTADGKVGATPTAYYLKKEYDTDGAEAYKERLVADILRFTFLVDFTDENLGSNNSGISLRFKGWGNDNLRATKEALITKAIKRRLRLLGYSWSLAKNMDSEAIYEEINNIDIVFSPNIPQSDTELIEIIQGLYGTVSDRTLYEVAQKLTGVNPDTEEERIAAEKTDAVADSLRKITSTEGGGEDEQ